MVVVVVVNASLQHSPPSSYFVVVVVLKVARFCARACVLCISAKESRNLWRKGTLNFSSVFTTGGSYTKIRESALFISLYDYIYYNDFYDNNAQLLGELHENTTRKLFTLSLSLQLYTTTLRQEQRFSGEK